MEFSDYENGRIKNEMVQMREEMAAIRKQWQEILPSVQTLEIYIEKEESVRDLQATIKKQKIELEWEQKGRKELIVDFQTSAQQREVEKEQWELERRRMKRDIERLKSEVEKGQDEVIEMSDIKREIGLEDVAMSTTADNQLETTRPAKRVKLEKPENNETENRASEGIEIGRGKRVNSNTLPLGTGMSIDQAPVPSGGERQRVMKAWLFAGDCQLVGMTTDLEIQTAAFFRYWELRMKPKCSVLGTGNLLRQEQGKYKYRILAMGSNDLVKKDAEEVLRDITEITREEIRKENSVVLWIPPPRNDIPEDRYRAFVSGVEQIGIQFGVKTVRMENMGDETFLLEHGTGKHMLKESFRKSFDNLLRELGEREIGNPGRLHPRLLWPDRCWVCGRRRFTHCVRSCRIFDQCKICDLVGHVEEVCNFQVRMCSLCGQRKHHPMKCPNLK